MMPNPKAIIFDLDDTLFAERDYAFSGFDAVAAAFGERLKAGVDLPARMRELFDSPLRSRVFNTIAAECGGDVEAIVPAMIDAFRRHAPRIALLPDAEAVLTKTRSTHRLGVITDGYSIAQHAKIDALGLRSRVDEIIVTDDWGREFWKPHPRAFEETASRLGVPPSACTYVADNPAKDFIAPLALGWQTVQVRRPGGTYTDQPAAPHGAPHRTIDSLHLL